MNTRTAWTAVVAIALIPQYSSAQQACPSGGRIEGTVSDPTGAVVPGAQVTTNRGNRVVSDSLGRYTIACAPIGSMTVHAEMPGFEEKDLNTRVSAGAATRLDIQLAVSSVQQQVQVSADSNSDPARGVGVTALSTHEVEQLADDPDDFARQLQALAASGGGIPGSAIITVDGFQNASALPPKSTIASITINPDMFSPQYEVAPYLGGRVEILTKPGIGALHGALFFTDSDGSFNATDPFSVAGTPASKQRYGFQLSGPLISKRSGFSLALEKRNINEFNIVNAVTLDTNGSQTPLQQTVPAPERLWIGSARNDWQFTPNDVATLSYSANVNDLRNQGIGGLTAQSAGYSGRIAQYDLRLFNVNTLGPNLLHQTHLGYTWKRTQHAPNSTASSLQVAGYFTSGGNTGQALDNRERDLEIDDDWMLAHKNQSITIGAQSLGMFIHDYDPDTFNGAYVFGGGTAPELNANGTPTGQTITITGLEQYRRALSNQPGGNPTTYQVTTGDPSVPLTQWRLALYAGDSVKVSPRLTMAGGLRYQLQTTPASAANFSPRLSMSWALNKKSSWLLHGRAGLFHAPNTPAFATNVYRLDGIRQQAATVYSPSYQSPLVPTGASIQVGTINRFPSSLDQVSSLQTHIGIDHSLPKGWHTAAVFYWAEEWGNLRIRNINAPLVQSSNSALADPTAALLSPRPITPNENIFEYQNSGHLSGDIAVVGADHPLGKYAGFSAYYVFTNFTSNAGSGTAPISPQSSYSNRGEAARLDGEVRHAIYANGSLHLPYKVDLFSILDAESGAPYNVVTGIDTNGDGIFNDRPSHTSASGSGVYATRFGLLSTTTINGDVPRNLGTMPARIHLDANLSRNFTLNPKDKDDLRTLSFTARAANLINHTNVTTVGNVISSSTFSQPLAAETARRIELGLRFAF
jgi:hypothetical protein